MATILIPTPLRKFTNNSSRLQVKSGTIQQAVDDLAFQFPELKKHLLDDKGQIRSFINIFVGEDDIRDLQQGETVLSEHTEVSIIPAIAGGMS